MSEPKHKPKWTEEMRRAYVHGWMRAAQGEKPNPLLATKPYISGYEAGRQALADAKLASYRIGGLIEQFSASSEQTTRTGSESE